MRLGIQRGVVLDLFMSVLLLLLAAPSAAAFRLPAATPQRFRHAPIAASAKILPAVHTGLGGTLLYRAAEVGSFGAASAVLGSAGLLAALNLAVTDTARYASAKRATSSESPGKEASKWYKLVRVQVFGQVAGLTWMCVARGPTGVLRGAAAVMAANVLFFLFGAAEVRHDAQGLPAAMPPGTAKFVLGTDMVLFGAAMLASVFGSMRTVGSFVFATGCLIGAAEGAPKTAAALKSLLS